MAQISDQDKAQHTNKITQSYVTYVKKLNPKYSKNVGITYTTGMNLLRDVNGKIKPVRLSNESQSKSSSLNMSSALASSAGIGVSSYPVDNQGKTSFLKKHYKVMAGAYPTKTTDVVLTKG